MFKQFEEAIQSHDTNLLLNSLIKNDNWLMVFRSGINANAV